MHSSYAADVVASPLADAQNERQTVRRNQRRHDHEHIRASHGAQQCRVAAFGRHRSLVFPGGRLGFPRGLSGRPRSRQRLADVDDAAGWNATGEPADQLGGGLVRVTRDVEPASVTAVTAVQRRQRRGVDATSQQRIRRTDDIQPQSPCTGATQCQSQHWTNHSNCSGSSKL